jgi:hypothetical protein
MALSNLLFSPSASRNAFGVSPLWERPDSAVTMIEIKIFHMINDMAALARIVNFVEAVEQDQRVAAF